MLIKAEERDFIDKLKKEHKPAIEWIKYKFNIFWAGHLLVYNPNYYDLPMIMWYRENVKKGIIKIEHMDSWAILKGNIFRHHPNKVLKYFFKKEEDAVAFKLLWLQ